jgi:hypothetical protein
VGEIGKKVSGGAAEKDETGEDAKWGKFAVEVKCQIHRREICVHLSTTRNTFLGPLLLLQAEEPKTATPHTEL